MSAELSQIIIDLQKQGAAIAHSGKTHAPRVAEVIHAFDGQLFEGDFCENRSGTLQECIHVGTGCSLKALWGVLDGLIDGVLSSTTLADLLSFTGLQQLRAEGERLLEARGRPVTGPH